MLSLSLCVTDMPLNCPVSSLSVHGTILSNATKTLRNHKRRKHFRIAHTDWHPQTQLCLWIRHQWITRKCLTLIMHVLCLQLDFFFYSHRLKIHRLPFLSQTSCIHLVHWFGIQHFDMFSACDSVKCLLHWSQLKRLQSLAPEWMLIVTALLRGYTSVQTILSICSFFFFLTFPLNHWNRLSQKKKKYKHLCFCLHFWFFLYPS